MCVLVLVSLSDYSHEMGIIIVLRVQQRVVESCEQSPCPALRRQQWMLALGSSGAIIILWLPAFFFLGAPPSASSPVAALMTVQGRSTASCIWTQMCKPL